MKTRLFIATWVLVLSALLIFAPNMATAKVKRISILTASTGGTWYIMGGAMSKVINTYLPNVEATPEVTGGGLENIRLLLRGKADFILTTDAQILNVLKKREKVKKSNFRALFTGIASAFHVVVYADSPIRSISDLKGRRIGTPALNDGGEIMARATLEAYGLSYKDAKSAKHLSLGELASAFKDGFIDAALCGGGVPLSAVMDMTTSKNCRLIPIDAEKVEWITTKYPEYTQSFIRKGGYKGVEQDLLSYGTRTAVVTLAGMDEDLCYRITKTILEHTKDLAEIHPQGRTYNIQEALLGVKSIPIHAGAIRYYKEKGAWEKKPKGVFASW